jgi:hypothetical protein
MCESCAEEHTEVDDNEVQRLKPEDRYVYAEESQPTVWVVSSRKDGSPHPFVEAVYDNQDAAREHKKELAEDSFKHNVVAWSVHERTLHTETHHSEGSDSQ